MPNENIVDQFTAQVDRFVRSPHVNEPELVERFVRAVAPRPDERALDVGCGPGLLAKAFAPRLRELVGVDITPAMVERARTIALESGLANARFETGDATKLPFESALFDVALTRLALHHMPEPRRVLREMARVLRPGGRLGAFDMITSELTEEAAYHNLVERLRDPSHARALPLSELVQLVGLAGLDLETIEMLVYEIDVEDWVARAEQGPDEARRARELLADAVGTRRFGGRRVWRTPEGRLRFAVRYAVLVATKPPSIAP